MKSIIVYGDIHGCLDEFKKLRDKVQPNSNDIEISVGDFLNKGPHSIKTLRYIIKNSILSVMGNNEGKMIKIYKKYTQEGKRYLNSIKPHERTTLEGLKESDIEHLKSLPYFWKFNNLTVLHGGLTKDTKLDENLDTKTKKEIMLTRFLDKNLNPIPWDDFENRYKFWSEIYDGREGFIVFGHHPFSKPKADKYALGIDTGCVYGGKLTAAKFNILDSKKVDTKNYKLIFVDAKRDYWG